MAAQAVAPPLCVCTPFVVVYYSCMNRKARALTHSKLPPAPYSLKITPPLLTPGYFLRPPCLICVSITTTCPAYALQVTPAYSLQVTFSDLRVDYNNVPRLCTHCHACCCLLCASMRACACESCVGIISGLSTFRYSTFRTFRYASCVSLLRTKNFAVSEVNL